MSEQQNFRGADFAGQDLRGRNFTNADLRGANFTEANLGGVDFSGANLRGARLGGANLATANLEGADLVAVHTDEATQLPAGTVLPENERSVKRSFEETVLATYMPDGKLTGIPMRRRKHLAVLLDHIVERAFAAEQIYTEKEVSRILAEYHPDFATLRRLLVDLHYMTRSGGVYRRLVRLSGLKNALAEISGESPAAIVRDNPTIL
jgi:hypothetical protein